MILARHPTLTVPLYRLYSGSEIESCLGQGLLSLESNPCIVIISKPILEILQRCFIFSAYGCFKDSCPGMHDDALVVVIHNCLLYSLYVHDIEQ